VTTRANVHLKHVYIYLDRELRTRNHIIVLSD